MDYSLAALKLFCGQLKEARQTHSQTSSSSSSSPATAMTFCGILFQRAWLQGVLVSEASDEEGGSRFLLDDGTGVVELSISNEFQREGWKIGMYIMSVGLFIPRAADLPMIKVHKMVDLSPFPDREALWHLEVIEAYKMFYQPSPED